MESNGDKSLSLLLGEIGVRCLAILSASIFLYLLLSPSFSMLSKIILRFSFIRYTIHTAGNDFQKVEHQLA